MRCDFYVVLSKCSTQALLVIWSTKRFFNFFDDTMN